MWGTPWSGPCWTGGSSPCEGGSRAPGGAVGVGSRCRWPQRRLCPAPWCSMYPRGLCPFLGTAGRSAPGGCLPAASISPVRNGGKNTRGERFSPRDSPLWSGISFGVALFFCGLACGPVSTVGSGPPPGWAGWEAWVGGRRDRAGKNPAKKYSPKRKFPNQGPYLGHEKTTTARLRHDPKRGSEPQRAVLFLGGAGGNPLRFFPPAFL